VENNKRLDITTALLILFVIILFIVSSVILYLEINGNSVLGINDESSSDFVLNQNSPNEREEAIKSIESSISFLEKSDGFSSFNLDFVSN